MKIHLGLGLAYQCLSVSRLENRWADAADEFDTVRSLATATHRDSGSGRHAFRLAAEATAGQALNASLTVAGPERASVLLSGWGAGGSCGVSAGCGSVEDYAACLTSCSRGWRSGVP